jgi:Ca2+-transporting ATPase
MNRISEGLNDSQVLQSRTMHGNNQLEGKRQYPLLREILRLFSEPMFLLLTATACVYFIIGHVSDSIIMMSALILIGLISTIQAGRSRNAMKLLKDLSAPRANAFRNHTKVVVAVEDLVVDDLITISEGESIPADGMILESKDLSVNESLITGESFPVFKYADHKDMVYRGCHIITGSALVKVTQVGMETKIGQIGKSVSTIHITKTPLQKQIQRFMIAFVIFGMVAFAVIVLTGILKGDSLWDSLLRALTLSMSILPEEIPVTFTSFLALAAIHLSRKNKIIVKQPIHVETLGSTSVIAVDKTGTLTKNEMTLVKLYDMKTKTTYDSALEVMIPKTLIEYAMWSSETEAFDPMEKSIHELYDKHIHTSKRNKLVQVKEYPLGGTPPMMTHVFQDSNGLSIIAMKGSPEKIMQQASMGKDEIRELNEIISGYAKQGLRVLAVGKGNWKNNEWPESQDSFQVDMLGLLAFHDPPKDQIKSTIESFHEAGIQVKMITGDYAETALAIADLTGIKKGERVVTGKEVMDMSMEELKKTANQNHIFARMFPEAKLKLVNAMKASAEVVAMTGDGVNDAPALKSAHIGIAMGKKGSEVARESSSLILSDDNLAHMVDAIALGRQVYDNIKKAILYIISIHVPIILIAGLPLLFSWKYNTIFSPIHIVFFELLMGPACALVFQNIAPDSQLMKRKPRGLAARLFTSTELIISIFLGICIAGLCLIIGYHYQQIGAEENYVRTMIFSSLFYCNLMLIVVGSSNYFKKFSIRKSFSKRLLLLVAASLIVYTLIIFIPALKNVFSFVQIVWEDQLICLTSSIVTVTLAALIKNKIRLI